MELTMAAQRTEQPEEMQSEGLPVKRTIENGGDDELAKKLKVEAVSASSCRELKRMVEIVLVLLTMAPIRKPTNTEIELMKQTGMQLEELSVILAPKDIAPWEAVETLIENLGLKTKSNVQRIRTEPGNLSIMPNNHNTEIAKIVQKLLQPMLSEHPPRTPPPSRDFMNKVFACQICRFTVNQLDTVLVCDACEEGFHFKCLQPSPFRKIPTGEWHCTRCLILSGQKPLPLKYDCVVSFTNSKSKLPSNT